MIQFATKEMVPQLMEIWQECFGDPVDYIQFYFSRRFAPQNTLAALVSGKPVAMLTMLPCEIASDAGVFPARYIYAVATRPEARGRGYSSALLSYAHRWMGKHGVEVSLLVPAEKSLFQFYRKRGYLPAFSVRQVELSRGEVYRRSCLGPAADATVITGELDPAGLYALREEFFGREGLFVRWDMQALRYVMEENAYTGGKILRFSTDSGHGYMICYKIKSKILVKECGARDEALLCRALLSAFPEEKFVLRLGTNSPLFPGLGHLQEFGAACHLGGPGVPDLRSLSERLTGQGCKQASYLNLVLD